MISSQFQHELDLSREATQQVRKQIQNAKEKKYFSSTEYGRRFVAQQLEQFAKDLVEATEMPLKKKATRTNIAMCFRDVITIFKYVPPEELSAVCLKLILDCFATTKYSTPTTQEAASKIGKGIESEVRAAYYTQVAPDYVVEAQRRELNTPGSNPHFRRYGAKRTVEKMLLSHGWNQDQLFPNWAPAFKTQIGLFILDVSLSSGYTTRDVRRQGRKTQGYIHLSDAVQANIIEFQNDLELNSFKYYPLESKPKDWEYLEGASRFNYSGGYYMEWVRKPLCRKNNHSEFGIDAINLLNTIQGTAWSIDPDIHQWQQECLNKGISIGKLKAVLEHPELNQDMPMELRKLPKDHPKRIEWRQKRHILYVQHSEAVTKSQRSRTSVSLAARFLEFPRFYLSWSCDYRGRMYSQQSFLHQQSSDFERALLRFSDGCKLDARGEYWAAQAVGSAFLGTKVSFKKRTDWTYENRDLIEAIANDPISLSSQWENASEPWQFLQLALEWDRVVLKKEKHLWDIPIGADASASGLQLLSAMRRDPKGMLYSNLFPPKDSQSPPLDAYQEVLRIASDLANQGSQTHYLAQYLTSRDLGKTILMKILYNASPRTNREDVRTEFVKQGLYPNPLDDKTITRITKLIVDASRAVFPMAFEAKEWIQKLCKIAKENGSQALLWTTPTQDSIELIKFNYKQKDIVTSHHGKVRIGTGEPKEINYRKIASALAPDFVHSYDASVLKSSFKDWDRPIALIHDCLKVLPNDMDRALERIRKGFVHVCSGDPLARLADDLEVSEEKLPRLTQGTGDLLQVLDSAYMFN